MFSVVFLTRPLYGVQDEKQQQQTNKRRRKSEPKKANHLELNIQMMLNYEISVSASDQRQQFK